MDDLKIRRNEPRRRLLIAGITAEHSEPFINLVENDKELLRRWVLKKKIQINRAA